jgi:hypothetical protein
MILAWRSSAMPKFYTASPANGGPRKLRRPCRRTGANSIQPELVSDMGRRFRQAPEQGGRTRSTYYRDPRGVEPVDRFIKALPLKQATKIEQQIAEHLNGRPGEAPPPEFPITSQIDAELRHGDREMADGGLQEADERQAEKASTRRRSRRAGAVPIKALTVYSFR